MVINWPAAHMFNPGNSQQPQFEPSAGTARARAPSRKMGFVNKGPTAT